VSPVRRSVVSLAVIVVALCAAWVAWHLQPPPPPPPSADVATVFDFPASAVRAIDVESWQGALRASRADGGWRVDLVELRQAAADPGATLATPSQEEVSRTLDALVGDLVRLPEIDRFPLGDRPPADFGLARPQARIVLALESGERRTLELGDLTVTTAALYARVLPANDALFRLRALAAPEAKDAPA